MARINGHLKFMSNPIQDWVQVFLLDSRFRLALTASRKLSYTPF